MGQLILNGSKYFNFYTVAQLKQEIIKHKGKILKISGYTEEQFQEIFQLLSNQITFVDDILIADAELKKAVSLVSGIDENDALFVALANHLHSSLWTGDKQLTEGLLSKGFNRIISTEKLYNIYIQKELKSQKLKK